MNDILVWKISGTHDSEDENYGLLDCDPHVAWYTETKISEKPVPQDPTFKTKSTWCR